MKINGACHCGDITFAAEVDPEQVLLCHCTDFQTLSGSPYRSVAPSIDDSFCLLSGELTICINLESSAMTNRGLADLSHRLQHAAG